jgi:hypothetical protein
VAPGRGWFLVVDEVPRAVSRPAEVAAALTVVLREGFTAPSLDPAWKVVGADRPGISVASVANALRLRAPAHAHAGIERSLPAGVRAVEAEIETGDDAGQDWGPGIALVWPDGAAAKLNLRLEDMKFGLYAAGRFEIAGGGLHHREKVRIRLLVGEEEVFFQRQDADGSWGEIGRMRREGLRGDPVALRVGKHAKDGGWRDFSSPGSPGECAVREIQILGR